jgi:hypothetical protein
VGGRWVEALIGNLRAGLNHYDYIPQMAELARKKLNVPTLAWAGARSFGPHCIDSAKAISVSGRRRDRGMRSLGIRGKDRLHLRATCGLLAASWGPKMTARVSIAPDEKSVIAISKVDHTGITVSSLQNAPERHPVPAK